MNNVRAPTPAFSTHTASVDIKIPSFLSVHAVSISFDVAFKCGSMQFSIFFHSICVEILFARV